MAAPHCCSRGWEAESQTWGPCCAMGLLTDLAGLLSCHTPAPVRFVVQELTEDATAAVLLREVELHGLLVRGQALVQLWLPCRT